MLILSANALTVTMYLCGYMIGSVILFYVVYLFFALIFKHKVGFTIAVIFSMLSIMGGVNSAVTQSGSLALAALFFRLGGTIFAALMVKKQKKIQIRNKYEEKNKNETDDDEGEIGVVTPQDEEKSRNIMQNDDDSTK